MKWGIGYEEKIILTVFIILLFAVGCLLTVCFVNQNITQKSEKITDTQGDNSAVDTLIGKWKFTKRITYPKVFSESGEERADNEYIGRIIEIKKELFKGKTFEIKNPFYNVININPYELMSGYGYVRNSDLGKYIKKEKYNLLELLENEPKNQVDDVYSNFSEDCYQDNDIWTLLVIDDDTMIFFESGCFEVKKIK